MFPKAINAGGVQHTHHSSDQARPLEQTRSNLDSSDPDDAFPSLREGPVMWLRDDQSCSPDSFQVANIV
jgi:hypothetical protein